MRNFWLELKEIMSNYKANDIKALSLQDVIFARKIERLFESSGIELPDFYKVEWVELSKE